MKGGKKCLILLLLIALGWREAESHQVCINLSAATNQVNNYCSDYNHFSCCSSQKDTEIQQMVNSLGITNQACLAFIKKTSCAVCDSWGAHLFGVEDQKPQKFPDLCGDYCSAFWDACHSVNMNWNANNNPFGADNPKILDHKYKSKADFCGAFAPSAANPGYCYSGKVFTPPSLPPPPQSSSTLCLEYFAQSSGGLAGLAIKLADLHSGDRMLLGYHNGRVAIVKRSNGQYLGDALNLGAYLDGEAGLHGVVAHPAFANNQKFYVYYSSKSRKAECRDDDWCNGNRCVNGACQNFMTNVLEEYRLNGNRGTLVRTLLTLSKPYPIHNGGDLTFGKDGKLYLPTGDGGSFNDPFNNAQNRNRRTGKVLRIDVDAAYLPGRNYGVPGDNPFLNSKFPEIYALGLRNPWRLSVDRNTGRMILGDVGQDNVEEVDVVYKGANYGWPKYEGNIVNPTRNVPGDVNPRTGPVITFTHRQGGTDSSVTGGYIYRGRRDACQYGRYIFGNWNSRLYYATDNGNGGFNFNTASNNLNYKCASGSACRSVNNVASFSEDDNGDLYILGTGGVFRLVEPSRCGISRCNGGGTPTSARTSAASTRSSNATPSTFSGGSDECVRKDCTQSCCKGSRNGEQCYDPNVHSCVNDDANGKLYLCAKGDKSCLGSCYDSDLYECLSTGLHPK